MLILLFLILLLPRVWIVLNSSYTFYSDDAIYATLAKAWILGSWEDVFHPTWPPLYPFFSALFYLFSPTWEISSRLTALIFGTAVLVPTFFLLRKTFSLKGAISFIAALSLFTPLLTISLMALSDSLAVLLVTGGIVAIFLALTYFHHQQTKLLILGSFLFGLAYLTRAEGTMFFSLSLLFLMGFFLITRQIKKFITTILVFGIIFVLTVSPYMLATRMQIGEWSLSQKFSAQIQQGHSFALNSRGNTWAQEVTSAKSPDYRSPYFKNGAEFVLNRLYYFLNLYPQKQLKWQQLFFSIFPFWVIPLMLLGIVSLLKKPFYWSSLYLIFIILTAVPLTIFSTPVQDVRYLAWTIPFFLYFFYLGVKRIVPKDSWAALLAFLAVLFFPGVSVNNLINPSQIAANFNQTYDKSELRVIGLWIKEHSPHPNPKVMLRHEGVEFYAGGETIYLPQISFEQLLEYAKKNQIDFLIAWDEELAGDEKLNFLLNDQIPHPGLVKVFSPTLPNSKIVVYKFIKD